MVAITQPQTTITAGVRQLASLGGAGPIDIVRLLRNDQAGTAATRATGFSTIGMLMSAESSPNRIAKYHTAL